VHAWLAAVNAGDADAALARTAPDVAIVGPRGTARGRAVLRAWLSHAGATFATRAVYARGDAVVVAQRGTWRDPATGATRGAADVATRFRVTNGQVAELQRYDELAAALREAGLTPADGIPLGGSPGATE
jgi:ketosteroid isomerase-like protein